MANNQKSNAASMATLPTELISMIVELSLPEDIASTYCVRPEPYTPARIEPSSPTPRKPLDETRYAVAYVKKRFNAEAMRILHPRQFRIEINEKSFHHWPGDADDEDWWFRTYGALTGCERRWSWCKTFPGLHLREIKELVVDITPSNLESFWYSATNAVRSLCENQLVPRGPIRKLVLQVHDMKESGISSEVVVIRDRKFAMLPVIGIDGKDYEEVLDPFKDILRLAEEREIRIPYWMNRSTKGSTDMKLWGDVGVKVVFVPLLDGSLVSRWEEQSARYAQNLVSFGHEDNRSIRVSLNKGPVRTEIGII